MAAKPGFVRLLSQERGKTTNVDTDAIFRGAVDRLLLSTPKETINSARRIFGGDNVHKIQTRFAEGEGGISTSENVLALPSQDDGHTRRVSTFKHLSILVSGSKSNYDTRRSPCTALVLDHGRNGPGAKDGLVMDVETGDYPGRTRLDHKPISDILLPRLLLLDPSADPGLTGRSLTSNIDDQLLFGFDPISEVLKAASSHLTVLHSFILDVLASLASHVVKWGPLALEGDGSELSFHETASCVTRIHRVLQSVTEATAKVNASTKIAGNSNVQSKKNRRKTSGDVCRCCGGRGHGSGPLIDPFLVAIRVVPETTTIKDTVSSTNKNSSVPPEFIFRDTSLPRKRIRTTRRLLHFLAPPTDQTKAMHVQGRISHESVQAVMPSGCTGIAPSFSNNIADLMNRERKRRLLKETLQGIKRIRLARDGTESNSGSAADSEPSIAVGEEHNTDRRESPQKDVGSRQRQQQQQQPSQRIRNERETPAESTDTDLQPISISPNRSSPRLQGEPAVRRTVDNDTVMGSRQQQQQQQQQPSQQIRNERETSAESTDTDYQPISVSVNGSPRLQEETAVRRAVDNDIVPRAEIITDRRSLDRKVNIPPLQLMGANLVPNVEVIASRVPSVIEDEALASDPQNRFIRARDVARKKSMNSVAARASNSRGPRYRPVPSL
uniref:Wsv131-like protein n=1 Tax=Melicertus latisulcatus pemonivirus TaxID=2984278 RepID=A0A9C7BVY9_9VIRU|nr:MAG: wsv131-like protein [Melicertus latisulcatus pemonivirus]